MFMRKHASNDVSNDSYIGETVSSTGNFDTVSYSYELLLIQVLGEKVKEL